MIIFAKNLNTTNTFLVKILWKEVILCLAYRTCFVKS